MCDFKEAIKLDPSLHSPHVCAGLIYLNRWYDSLKAVHYFSSAIKIDPTCVRAYLCRAEAYKAQRKVEIPKLWSCICIFIKKLMQFVSTVWAGHQWLHQC